MTLFKKEKVKAPAIDFYEIPGEVAVIIVKKGKYYLDNSKYSNIYLAYAKEKQKKPVQFEDPEDIKNKKKYKKKNAIALVPVTWIKDGTIELD